MSKLVLGILAVLVLQIAFGILMTYQTSADLTAAAISPNVSKSHASIGLNEPVTNSPAIEAGSAIVDSETGIAAGAGKSVDASKHRSELQNSATRPDFVSRQPSKRHQLQDFSPSVQRVYFGRMVVERSFGAFSRRARPVRESVSRQIFGKMMVERRSDIPINRAAKHSRSKKNLYVASYLPESKNRQIVSKG